MPVSPKSQGTAFIKCSFFPPGLTFAAALVIAWDISSMCDLSLLAPLLTGKCSCQLTSPVPPLPAPPVTLCISNRKNTNSPICFFITQRINMKRGSLLSCRTCKPPRYSAPNKHLLRVNKSSSWLSVCRECPSILGNLSLRKKKQNVLIFYSWSQNPREKKF